MNKQMQDLAAWSIETAKAAGADDCRVQISNRRFVEISYRLQKPENIKEATTRNLNIEIYVDNRYSGQSTSDLRQDALKDFISNAVVTTKLLAEDPHRTLPDPAPRRSLKTCGNFATRNHRIASPLSTNTRAFGEGIPNTSNKYFCAILSSKCHAVRKSGNTRRPECSIAAIICFAIRTSRGSECEWCHRRASHPLSNSIMLLE